MSGDDLDELSETEMIQANIAHEVETVNKIGDMWQTQTDVSKLIASTASADALLAELERQIQITRDIEAECIKEEKMYACKAKVSRP